MSKNTKASKTGSLSQQFKAAAPAQPDDALAFMFMAAFGVSLERLVAIAVAVVAEKDVKLVMVSITAAVQIRAHVVFVGADYGNIRTKYPELIIEGQRDQQDQFNFGALHALGHLFAHASPHALAMKTIKKSGSCITGQDTSESEAGKVNSEIARSWTPSDKEAFTRWMTIHNTDAMNFLGPFFDSMAARATRMQTAMNAALAPKAAMAPARPAVGSPANVS